VGWRLCESEWVAFLDDDVWVTSGWLDDLARDLDGECADGVTGRITVPLPGGRRASDWERSTAGLAEARWITADIAYRRSALASVGGFDERFRRAYREDADLALRVVRAGGRIVQGARTVVHPVRPAPWYASIAAQRGNADDVLIARLHGPGWRERAQAPLGRRPAHVLTSALAAWAVVERLRGRPRRAAVGACAWLAATVQFAWARIAPGPRDAAEVTRMAVTSAVIPAAATAHWLRGLWRYRRVQPWPAGTRSRVRAVLFDRDGTLVHDVPYNGRPELVRPVDGAREALGRLRAAGLATGVITNQSGVARGLIGVDEVRVVNARVEQLLGPFGTWQVCPHGEADGCGCRKPRPGLVLAAARELGVAVSECAVIGDTGADVAAGAAAGAALSILVANEVTLPSEVAAAPHRARSLGEAADLVLGERGFAGEVVA
jgi:histidinol-phosphate phosphatase family protein